MRGVIVLVAVAAQANDNDLPKNRVSGAKLSVNEVAEPLVDHVHDHASMLVDNLVDNVVGSWFKSLPDKAPATLPSYQRDVENMTLGMPARMARLKPNSGRLFPLHAKAFTVSGHTANLRGKADDGRGMRKCIVRAIGGTEQEEAKILEALESQGQAGLQFADVTTSFLMIEALQGVWEDDVGNRIVINGTFARFVGQRDFPIEIEDDGSLMLRGTRFVGTADEPRWRFQDGTERRWVRPDPISPDQEAWRDLFADYKQRQMQLRRQIWAAASAEDFHEAARVQTAFAEGGSSVPPGTSLSLQARLLSGRLFVPGVCFVHRKFGYRGVIVGCEAWCAATAEWRKSMGVDELTRGESQPFYHCLVDTRDREDAQITFVAEENVEASPASFPIEHPHTETLLIQCDEIQGYVPSPKLEHILRVQRDATKNA